MSFSYQAISREEAEQNRFKLLPEGEYDAVVEKATAKVSQTGNTMIELVLSVFDQKGVIHGVFDYLVFTPGMVWKVIHFCDAIGLSKEYDGGTFTPDMAINRNCRVKISLKSGNVIPVEKLNGKPQGSKYPDKNIVDDYVKSENAAVKKDDFSDDMPF